MLANSGRNQQDRGATRLHARHTTQRPSGLHVSADDTLYVSDQQSNEARHPGWARGIRVGRVKKYVR